jgi:catechol 2,3-dioxygenase-like lactoylglutathione lyase family enzyme
MKRLHIGLKVANLSDSIEFYTILFGCSPTMKKADYAKWMLDDPLVNFSINTRSKAAGFGHFGIQVDTDDELKRMRRQLDSAGLHRSDQDDLLCGYHLQTKSWLEDPEGIPWETFFTHRSVDECGTGEIPDSFQK